MAMLPVLYRGVQAGLERIGLGPVRNSSPEDDGTPPDLDSLYSRSPEMTILGMTGPWIGALLAQNDDSILRREGAQDLRLFDRLLDDDVAMSNLQQRRLAITSKDWEVTPGDDKDPRSIKAAADFKAMLQDLGFDNVTGLLHYAVWYGYAVAEGLWTTKVHEGRRIIWLSSIVVPDRRWFGFTLEGDLRYVAAFASSFGGEEVPPNKFCTIRTGGSHDFSFYGLGLAHWCYWPIWFKRASLKFWALYLEKLANPTAVGEFEDSAGVPEKRKLLDALLAIGRDSAVALPKGSAASVKFMEAQRTGIASSSYKEFVTEQNEALMRIVLGQPGTSKATPQGVGGKQAQVHQDVKEEIVKADADLICEAINATFAKWVTRWNYGEDVAPPRVFRALENVMELDQTADRDVKLAGIGIRRTADSVHQIYGDGYEMGPPVVTNPGFGGGGAQPGEPGKPPAAANDQEAAAERRAQFAAMGPTPLYVSRKLLNADELITWAKGEGFRTLDPAADLHVTILYSKTPVDWFGMGETWSSDPKGGLTVIPGGQRAVSQLGDKAIALQFACPDLNWRHESMVSRGASHDFETYAPHVTFSHDAAGVDLAAVEPFAGELRFGPEIFEEIEEDPSPLSMFSAVEEDEIERLTAALMDETNPLLLEFAASLKDSLASARSAAGGTLSLEGARVALLQAFERFPTERLAKLTGLPFLAERAAAEAGVESRVTA